MCRMWKWKERKEANMAPSLRTAGWGGVDVDHRLPTNSERVALFDTKVAVGYYVKLNSNKTELLVIRSPLSPFWSEPFAPYTQSTSPPFCLQPWCRDGPCSLYFNRTLGTHKTSFFLNFSTMQFPFTIPSDLLTHFCLVRHGWKSLSIIRLLPKMFFFVVFKFVGVFECAKNATKMWCFIIITIIIIFLLFWLKKIALDDRIIKVNPSIEVLIWHEMWVATTTLVVLPALAVSSKVLSLTQGKRNRKSLWDIQECQCTLEIVQKLLRDLSA